jgi:hypothetical protein
MLQRFTDNVVGKEYLQFAGYIFSLDMHEIEIDSFVVDKHSKSLPFFLNLNR